MKRIFRDYPISTDVTGVFRYDYGESISRCMENIHGIYHSKNVPIHLNWRCERHTMAVPGWDLGNGNILSLPVKVCECAAVVIGDDCFIAYTCWTGGNLVLNIAKVDQALWLNPEINAIDYASNMLTITNGINSRLQFDGAKLFWRMYDSAVTSSPYKIYSYDLRQKKMVQLTDVPKPAKTYCPRELLIEQDRAHFVHLRKSGIYCIHIYPKKQDLKAPAIVICLGGPYIKIPDIRFLPQLYHQFSDEGYHVIIPLRRGVVGLSSEWERALSGNYGIADVEDILASTRELLSECKSTIDSNRLGLYGASYGGYSALLINGKHNGDFLFKSVVSHCGVYDLSTYPEHSSGNACDIMIEYGRTDDIATYTKNIHNINPASFVNDWKVPTLLVHTIDDTTTWFGQSVGAYNAGLNNARCNISLILAEGGHSYNISNEEPLYDAMIDHFNKTLMHT